MPGTNGLNVDVSAANEEVTFHHHRRHIGTKFKTVMTTALVAFVWLLLGAGVFTQQDDTVEGGIWFGYITSTTIGLGDYAPSTAFTVGFGYPLSIVGLALFDTFLENLNEMVNPLTKVGLERIRILLNSITTSMSIASGPVWRVTSTIYRAHDPSDRVGSDT